MTATQSEHTWLEQLSQDERVRFLAFLTHGLTISSRVLCHSEGNPDASIEQLRLLNEAQHQVTGYFSYCVTGKENIDFLAKVVTSVLSIPDEVARQQAQQAWSYAKHQLRA